MKKMKKLLSMLLAVVMVLAMAVPSFADGTDTPTVPTGSGSITISNAIKGEKYGVYQLFTATRPEGNSSLIAYYATETQKNAIKSYVYTFEEEEKTVTISNPFKFNDTPNSDGLYSVELQDELKGKDKEKEITKYLQGLYNDKPGLFIHYTEWEWESAVDSDMSHTFNNLPYGYYFIKCGNGAVVSITSTTPSANIIDKNQKGPGVFTKKIIPNDKLNAEVSEAEKKEVDTANYTDTVTYEVVVDTTNYDGAKSIANYYIQDTLQKGLSYVTVTNENNKKVVTPIEIYVNSVAPTNKITYTGGEVVEDSDTEPLLLQDGTRLEGGSRFNITIPWSTFNKETNEATFLTNANSSD